MFKSGKVLLVVDSVEKAVKFYTEKLLFSIAELRSSSEGGIHLSLAELRKGKFAIVFRLPTIEELAEFSMIRRCVGRSVFAVLDAKREIDKYYKNCKKKNLEVSSERKNPTGQIVTFTVKDPFGFRLAFSLLDYSERDKKTSFEKGNFYGMDMTSHRDKSLDALTESMIKWLRGFGISRRVAKKYIKVWDDEVGWDAK